MELYALIWSILLLLPNVDVRGGSGDVCYILFFCPIFVLLDDIGVIVHSSISLLLQIYHLSLNLILAKHRT